MKLTDDQRAELAAIISREGGAPGNSLHSWRCEDKDRYPEPCGCVAGVVDELVQVIESWEHPTPERPVEAAARVIAEAAGEYPSLWRLPEYFRPAQALADAGLLAMTLTDDKNNKGRSPK